MHPNVEDILKEQPVTHDSVLRFVLFNRLRIVRSRKKMLSRNFNSDHYVGHNATALILDVMLLSNFEKMQVIIG